MLAVGRAQLGGREDLFEETRALLALAANTSRAGLLGLDLEDFTDALMARFADLIEKRKSGMPMSHLRGARDFYKHSFKVTPDVLDPRADTEVLVEAALSGPVSCMLDLGTGSGCVLLSILDERPRARGIGTDISRAALGVAQENAVRLNLGARADFIRSDWFENVEGRFDLIVSNPPYISRAAFKELMVDVRDYEPRIALTDEGDGLSVYRLLGAQAQQYLKPRGRLIVEIGFDQAEPVQEIFHDGGFTEIQCLPDMEGRARVVSAVWQGDNAAV